MKLFYSLLLLFFFSAYTQAQIVNIPDANFKQNLIDLGIDLNNDGQIQQTEAEARTGQLFLNNSSIVNLTGINAFKNIDWLMLFYLFDLPSLNMADLTKLKTIEMYTTGTNNFTINYTGVNNVTKFIFQGESLTNFNFLNSFSNLEEISVEQCAADFVIHDLNKLKRIFWFRSEIRNCTLNLYNLPELQVVEDYISSTSIILNNLPKLESYLNMSSMNGGYAYGYTSALSINNVPRLKRFTAGFLAAHSADFSNCTDLTKLSFANDYSQIKYLNLKNGAVIDSLVITGVTANDSLKVCVDDGEGLYVQNRLTQLGFNINKIMVSPFCSFTEGGTYNTIKGAFKFDGNANGCDAGDDATKQANITVTDAFGGEFVRSTDSAGNYKHYTGKGTFTVTPQFANPYFIITPANAIVYFDSANNYTANNDFCLTANGIKHDLEIALLPTWQPARPGFTAGYALVYKNTGNTTQSGSLQMSYNATKLSFASESTNTATQSVGQLSWNFANLKPFESKTINIGMNVLPSPANNIGDTLLLSTTINSVNTDETPANNVNNIKQPVQGSFDPNDKQCLEGNKIATTDLNGNLHYQIRFQNEGTDTAFNIVVADTLSSNYDETSFQLLASSHPCTIKRNGNIVHFNFANIKLPYKAIDEPSSHGYVSFTLKPKNNLVAGDSLNNKASIYFDFNLPVVTNKAVTVVSTPAVLAVKIEYINGQVDGNVNKLQWKMNCSGSDVIIQIERSGNGVNFENIKIMATTGGGCQLPLFYTDNSAILSKNYYRIKVIENNGAVYYSSVILLQQKTADFQIQSVHALNGNVGVIFIAASKKDFVMGIYSADGKLLSQKTIHIAAGTTIVDIPVKNMATGVYLISAKGNDILLSAQFINIYQ